MRLSVNEGYFRKSRSGKLRTFEQALSLCADGGFDTIDVGFSSLEPELNPILSPDYISKVYHMRDICDKLNMVPDQSHAPFIFNNLSSDDIRTQLERCVEASAVLGVKNIVVHADTYYEKDFDFDRALNVIYEVYAPIVESAVKNGIKIAMETLFEDRAPNGKRARFTSCLEELEAIVGKFSDKSVGICWDFGHARVVYGDKQFEQMKRVGSKIIATHVHDNIGAKDLHQMPYFGGTNWEEAMSTLKGIGYNGSFTLELVYGCIPDELLPDYIKLFHKTGMHMLEHAN